MKILLLAIGKTTFAPFIEAIERYIKRIPYYIPFEFKELPDIKNTKNLTENQQKDAEGKQLLSVLTSGDCFLLLDEKGKGYTSREFSKFIASKMNTLSGRLVFAIGGPYGFSQSVYDRCDGKISLSKMTFPHDMVRVFFVEQIYRAMTIMRGEPYHHD